MSEVDISELARIKYRCLSILPFTSFCCLLSLVCYLIFRTKCILEAYVQGLDPLACLSTCLYLVSEIGILFPSFLNHALRCLSFPGSSKARRLRLQDGNAPRVDVLITCAGEEDETVFKTIEAACASDYPVEAFRVIVLDDGASAKLSEFIAELANTRHNLHYAARPKDMKHGFKAGNLNYGLDFVKSLPSRPAEYIAALDADMIPDPEWLRALLPHLLQNPKAALAQSPQRFYDVPSNDPLLQGLDVNYKVTEPLKESTASTWCGGSGYIIRRSALDGIGGFPTESVGEDMYCSNVLLGKGWTMVYVDETLQNGRVPESYKAHTKQQGRWHVGRIQSAIAMGWYVYGSRSQKMSIRQRLTGLIYALLSVCNIVTTISILVIPIVLYNGFPLVAFARREDLCILLRLVSFYVVSEWLDDCVVSLVTGYRIALSEGHATYWISPYHAVAIIGAFIPDWIKHKQFEFAASGADGSATERRDASKQPPLSERLRTSLWANKVGFHLIYILIIIACLVQSSSRVFHRQHRSTEEVLVELLTHVAWPPLPWLVCLNSFLVPLQYACSPPTIPNHAQLLKRDPIRRASYPKEVHDDPGHFWRPGSQELNYTVIVAYSAALLFFSSRI